jgi:hypothetical protein
MKHRTLVFLSLVAAVCLVATVGCSTLTTSADYDPTADFSKYRTWEWKDDGSINNDLLSKRIQTALESTLSQKGLVRNPQNPDLLVVVHARLSKQTQINTYDTGWGYGWRWGGGMSTSTVSEIPVGTLVLDFVDVSRKELVWRGTASDTLNPEKSPEQKDQALREALAKMLEKYPPPKKA